MVGGAHKLWLRSRTLSSRYDRKIVANFKLKHNILCFPAVFALVVVAVGGVVVVVDAVVAAIEENFKVIKNICVVS